jgi:hypothetical protein
MLENRKPRHIRDIAHLYISRPQPAAQTPTVSVWIVADHKCCFPGFHVANLAAALSVKNCPVRVLDRSGLLPNAGYFMALPSWVYIRWEEDSPGLSAGLAGVEVDCSSEEPRVAPQSARPARAELIHLPPLSPEAPMREALQEAKERGRPANILLVLRTGRTLDEGILPALGAELRSAATFALTLAEYPCGDSGEPTPSRAGEPGAIDLGRIVGWERALDDRIPPVVRTPHSALSQAYRSTAEALLFKINDLGRKIDATRVTGISVGAGSRPHHR